MQEWNQKYLKNILKSHAKYKYEDQLKIWKV